MMLPGGEPLPARGWLGMALGFSGLAALVWPSVRSGLAGNHALLWAIAALLASALSLTVGSLVGRRSRLPVNCFVAASWQMLLRRRLLHRAGNGAGRVAPVSLERRLDRSLAWLITGGSLAGYSAFIYLLEHVPVAKVASYAYVNPVVAVLLGVFLLHERPDAAEFAGMAGIVVAVFLLTSARVLAKPRPIEELEQMPAE